MRDYMMQWPPKGFFNAKPSGWTSFWPVEEASWRNDPALKKLFGEQLAKYPKPFDAACVVFGADTNKALWASVNWPNDPIVLQIKETLVETEKKILDKDSLCHKLLTIADEKSPQGYYIVDAEVKLKYFELYAKIQGYVGKPDNTTINNNNFTNNSLKIKFVKPEIKEQQPKIIEHQEAIEQPQHNSNLVKLKLVSTGA